MLDITRDLACDRIELFATEGRLTQGSWHTEKDGRQLACLLGAIDPSVDSSEACPSSVMPSWLAHLLPALFDGVSEDNAISYGMRFAKALRNGNTDESVMRKFLIVCVESAVNYARPVSEGKSYWDAVEKSCGDVVKLLSSKKKTSKAAADAADAAADAAYAADVAADVAARAEARAAADAARAARAAARAARAAYAAADAADAAARSAADAADATADAAYAEAYAAADENLFDALLAAMEG